MVRRLEVPHFLVKHANSRLLAILDNDVHGFSLDLIEEEAGARLGDAHAARAIIRLAYVRVDGAAVGEIFLDLDGALSLNLLRLMLKLV